MKDEFVRKHRMWSIVKTHLRKPAHQTIWLNKGTRSLHHARRPVRDRCRRARRVWRRTIPAHHRRHHRAKPRQDRARRRRQSAWPRLAALLPGQRPTRWDLSLSEWRALDEGILLTKARALHAAILPLTTGATPPGKPYGLTAAKAQALKDLIDDYDAVIGQPGAARGNRKAKTSDLRPRTRVVDGILAGMDDLIVQFRGTPAGDLFVEGYFNARRIGGQSSGGEEDSGGDTPTPPPPQ